MSTQQTPKEKNRSPLGLTNQALPSCSRIEKGFPPRKLLGNGNELLAEALAIAGSRVAPANAPESSATQASGQTIFVSLFLVIAEFERVPRAKPDMSPCTIQVTF